VFGLGQTGSGKAFALDAILKRTVAYIFEETKKSQVCVNVVTDNVIIQLM
jgi:hypothetical protein